MKYGPHILISSDSGTGKSHFAATIINARNPRPVLVQAFDPSDKLAPYRARGDRVTLDTEWQFGRREQVWVKDKLVAVIERWHEREGKGSLGVVMRGGGKTNTSRYTTQGVMFENYLARMQDFMNEADQWYAFVHDSATFFEFSVRQYLVGRMRVQDNRMVWAQTTDEIERFYLALLPDLDITTIVLSHASTEREPQEDGASRYAVRLPGRLSKDVIAAFGEVYRGFVVTKKGESPEFFMQTAPDGVWRCSSQLHIPSPFGPSPKWRDLWQFARNNLPEGTEE